MALPARILATRPIWGGSRAGLSGLLAAPALRQTPTRQGPGPAQKNFDPPCSGLQGTAAQDSLIDVVSSGVSGSVMQAAAPPPPRP